MPNCNELIKQYGREIIRFEKPTQSQLQMGNFAVAMDKCVFLDIYAQAIVDSNETNLQAQQKVWISHTQIKYSLRPFTHTHTHTRCLDGSQFYIDLVAKP